MKALKKILCIVMAVLSISFIFCACAKDKTNHVHKYGTDRICDCGKLDPCYTFLELVDAHNHKSKYFAEFDICDTYYTDFTIGYDNKSLESIYLLSVQVGAEYGYVTVVLPILLINCKKHTGVTERGYLYYSIYNDSDDHTEEGKFFISLSKEAYRESSGVVSSISAKLKRGVKNYLKLTFKYY